MESDSVLYYLMQSIIVARNLYNPIVTETRERNGAMIPECNDPLAKRYLEKVAQLAKSYLRTYPSLSVHLVIYNSEAEFVEQWSFDCTRMQGAVVSYAVQAVVNQITATSGFLTPLDPSHKFKVLARVDSALDLAGYNLRLSQALVCQPGDISLTPVGGIKTSCLSKGL